MVGVIDVLFLLDGGYVLGGELPPAMPEGVL